MRNFSSALLGVCCGIPTFDEIRLLKDLDPLHPRLANLGRAANAIRARGQQADPLTLDVRDVEAVKTTIAAQEPFDILVNNAGTNRPAPFVDVKVEDFDFVFGLNVRAAYFLAQAVARRLIDAKKSGSIINMSSQMGHVGGP